MSVFCPKCQNITYDEYTCDKCQHIIKEKSKHNYQPKKRNKLSSYKGNQQDKVTIKLNKNIILITAVVVIAISVSYLAINKYRENQAMNEWSEMFFGTSDPDELKEMIKKQNIQNKRMIENSKKQFEKTLKTINENQKNMFK